MQFKYCFNWFSCVKSTIYTSLLWLCYEFVLKIRLRTTAVTKVGFNKLNSLLFNIKIELFFLLT